MPESSCELRGNRLVVSGEFSRDADTALDSACQGLLAADDRELFVDLVAVGYISSTYIGVLAELCLSAREAGRKLTVRAGPKITALLKEAGLDSAAAMEEVG